jgi:cell division protein FtsZ
MVIGVGGAGGNTVDHIFKLSIKGVNLMICNTDSKALDKSPLEPSQKICMGDGKGAGNDAAVGRNKAKESLAEIRQYVESRNPDLIFLTAGMGGGTGTGATPVIAQMIHALNIPVIAILTTPPINEGIHRFEQAMEGIRSMRELVDTFIVIKNETIIELSEERSVHDAFNMANDIVAYASKGIAEIALTQSDLVSVDISDVCKVVRNSRYAVMGMASESGEDRVVKAIKAAVLSPLFGNVPIKGSKEVLVNFATSSPSELKMKEVNKALNYIQEIASGEDENGDRIPVNIIWGTSIKPELEDKIEIIIVVTGFHANTYYSEAFGGRLDLADEQTPAVAPQQPAEPIVVKPVAVSRAYRPSATWVPCRLWEICAKWMLSGNTASPCVPFMVEGIRVLGSVPF